MKMHHTGSEVPSSASQVLQGQPAQPDEKSHWTRDGKIWVQVRTFTPWVICIHYSVSSLKRRSLIIPILWFYKFTDCFEIQSSVIYWLTSTICSFLISQSLLQHNSSQWEVNRHLLGLGVVGVGEHFTFLTLVPPYLPSSCRESCLSTGREVAGVGKRSLVRFFRVTDLQFYSIL